MYFALVYVCVDLSASSGAPAAPPPPPLARIYTYILVYIYIYIYTHTLLYLCVHISAPHGSQDDSREPRRFITGVTVTHELSPHGSHDVDAPAAPQPPPLTRYTRTHYTYTHLYMCGYISAPHGSHDVSDEKPLVQPSQRKRDAPAHAHRSVRSGVRFPIPPWWSLRLFDARGPVSLTGLEQVFAFYLLLSR